ncbi:flagellar protein FlgN [Metabacillus herbersteinensis]|uniref:Flagellar protein FlgN n=1 Tax=Metabacillus herbersteinensis TaxID=283816 RepID=A0ABV6GEX0_9BACI
MLADKLITTLEKLLSLHEQLYKVALQKSEILKKDLIDELREILKQEQKLVQAIKQIEAERILITAEYLNREQELTLRACIDQADGLAKERLQTIHHEFQSIMDKLKAVNQLNQQLTQQSLQFVSISLDMLMPQENAQNYNRPDQSKGTATNRRSIFDSKA